MNEDGTPIVAAPADEKPDYSSPNDLSFEMTEDEEKAFVNEQLGISEPAETAPDTKPEPAAPVVAPSPPEPAPAPVPAAPAAPEPDKPAEIEPVKTDDLWIEVDKVSTDDEGNQTAEKVKLVYDPEDPASFIPDDFKFKSDKQLADIMESKQEMASLFKDRTKEFTDKTEAVEATKTEAQNKADQLAGWDAELSDLIDAGIIDAPKLKEGDKGFLEDPAVVKIDAVFKYMTSTNEERAKEGKAPILSFGTAFTMFENSEAVKAETAAKEKENEDAKRKGALIGGSSAASTGTSPSYIAGSASNIWEVPVE